MDFEYLIAKSYITQKKETGFITLITYISIAGLSIGIAALILTLGIMNGFEQTIIDKIIGFKAHINLATYHYDNINNSKWIIDKLEEYPEIESYSPYLQKECILRFDPVVDGVYLRGIDPEKVNAVANIGSLITDGELDLGADDEGYLGIILGKDLAEKFEVQIGNLIIAANIPENRRGFSRGYDFEQYRVRGLYESGMSDFDKLYAFIHIDEARRFFQSPSGISGVDIRLNVPEAVEIIADKMTDEFGYPLKARTWREDNPFLFSWMKSQRLPILIAFGMIILVGSINLISTLVLIVYEKQKDIGILKSIGSTSKSIMKIFLIDGIIIGIVSISFGSGLAYLLGWLQNTYKLITISKEIYFISEFPVELAAWNFLQINILAMILCMAATMYPAWKASKLMPIEAVRNE